MIIIHSDEYIDTCTAIQSDADTPIELIHSCCISDWSMRLIHHWSRIHPLTDWLTDDVIM